MKYLNIDDLSFHKKKYLLTILQQFSYQFKRHCEDRNTKQFLEDEFNTTGCFLIRGFFYTHSNVWREFFGLTHPVFHLNSDQAHALSVFSSPPNRRRGLELGFFSVDVEVKELGVVVYNKPYYVFKMENQKNNVTKI